jgi:hypothetical protein
MPPMICSQPIRTCNGNQNHPTTIHPQGCLKSPRMAPHYELFHFNQNTTNIQTKHSMEQPNQQWCSRNAPIILPKHTRCIKRWSATWSGLPSISGIWHWLLLLLGNQPGLEMLLHLKWLPTITMMHVEICKVIFLFKWYGIHLWLHHRGHGHICTWLMELMSTFRRSGSHWHG